MEYAMAHHIQMIMKKNIQEIWEKTDWEGFSKQYSPSTVGIGGYYVFHLESFYEYY